MDYLHKPRRLLITGKSGTGKSEYFIRYVQAVGSNYARVFICDHEGEFSDRTGWPSARTVEDLEKISHVECFDPIDLYPGDKSTAFEFYADYCFAWAQSREDKGESFLFCCDELQKIDCVNTDIIPHDLACLVETGRRYKIDTVFITQQPNLTHGRLRNQVTEVITFRQNERNAIKWLVEYGFDEDEIRELQSGEFICRTDQGVQVTGNIFSGGIRRADQPVDGGEPEAETGLDTEEPPEDSPKNESTESQASVGSEAE